MTAPAGPPARSRTGRAAAAASSTRSFRIGLLAVLAVVALAVPMFLREPIAVLLSGGETLTARFAADNVVRAYKTEVKVAGVPVGKVTSVDRADTADGGGAVVTMKVSDEAFAALGTAPSAAVRPTTLLGGRYYVDLVPGGLRGSPEGEIPVERTGLPVELEDVAAALQPEARAGGQSAVADLDAALAGGGDAALLDLLADAPATLDPATEVLLGLQGERPGTDLPALVGNLEATARVLTERRGQLQGIVGDLDAVSGVLARRAPDVAAALDTLPAALDSADRGLAALDTTMAELRATADPARDVADELDAFLATSGPVLAEARPAVADLRALLTDARPAVDRLIPAADDLTDVSDAVRGPVLDRVNGPILDTLNSPFAGTGPYAGNGGDYPLYQAVGYMLSNLNRSARYTDENGAVVSLQFGVGPGSAAGLPFTVEQMFAHFARELGGAR